MSRSKHSPDEKLQAVMESLDHNTTQAEICQEVRNIPDAVEQVEAAVP